MLNVRRVNNKPVSINFFILWEESTTTIRKAIQYEEKIVALLRESDDVSRYESMKSSGVKKSCREQEWRKLWKDNFIGKIVYIFSIANIIYTITYNDI
jgi:hypothetical protein